MKSSEVKAERKRPIGWVIDPVASFVDGGPGHKDEVLIIAGLSREKHIERETLWKAGKRAFDLIFPPGEEISLDELEEFLTVSTEELASLWNRFRSPLEQMIEEGLLVIYPYDSEEPIKEFRELKINPTNPWAYLHLEPYIFAIDSLFEQSNLLSEDEEEIWPYDRELLGAYFTLCFLDDVAAGIDLNEENSEAAGWVTFWFDRIDQFNRTREVIKHQESIRKQQKSQSMNKMRHARRNEARQLVIDDWHQRKSEFRSAEKAGNYYADWLESKGFEFEPRTITTWIRKYAKDNGIKLR
ncbi:MAG: hypothetical protein CMC08_00230 [Flavobacteriaceae bacterium]|nr:hypothetical protein [Flavobacteriaceae bacterium]